MFEAGSVAFQAWREVLHVSEWTGLSVGMLAGLGALAWFVPPARTLAIAAGAAIAIAYGGLVIGNHTGRADVHAEWDAANERAKAAAAVEDADAKAALDAKYLQTQNDSAAYAADLQAQVRDYESKMVGMAAAGACQLGDPPLRLRQPRK